jgi:hypothetical protein
MQVLLPPIVADDGPIATRSQKASHGIVCNYLIIRGLSVTGEDMKDHAKRSPVRTKVRKQRRTNRSKQPAHPRTADEYFAKSEEFQTDWEEMLRVLKRMRTDGLSLKKAAKQEGVDPRMVPGLAGRALKRRSNRSYAVTNRDSLLRVLVIPTADGLREVSLRDSRVASMVGRYSEGVQKYVRTGDDSSLRKFNGKSVTDVNGVKLPLITNLSELNRLGAAGVLSFESLYAKSA